MNIDPDLIVLVFLIEISRISQVRNDSGITITRKMGTIGIFLCQIEMPTHSEVCEHFLFCSIIYHTMCFCINTREKKNKKRDRRKKKS